MLVIFLVIGILVFLVGLYFLNQMNSFDMGMNVLLIMICISLGMILPTPEEVHSSSLKEFNKCTEFLLYYPNANIISGGAVSMSAVPLECKQQFEAFYEAHTNWDLSYAWEKFKQYKIKQIT